MSGIYQIPGLILTVMCHIMAAYYINEQKYSKKIFACCSGIYAILFVSMMGGGFALGEWNAFFSYIGIVVLLFFYFCVVSRDGFPKKSFFIYDVRLLIFCSGQWIEDDGETIFAADF